MDHDEATDMLIDIDDAMDRYHREQKMASESEEQNEPVELPADDWKSEIRSKTQIVLQSVFESPSNFNLFLSNQTEYEGTSFFKMLCEKFLDDGSCPGDLYVVDCSWYEILSRRRQSLHELDKFRSLAEGVEQPSSVDNQMSFDLKTIMETQQPLSDSDSEVDDICATYEEVANCLEITDSEETDEAVNQSDPGGSSGDADAPPSNPDRRKIRISYLDLLRHLKTTKENPSRGTLISGIILVDAHCLSKTQFFNIVMSIKASRSASGQDRPLRTAVCCAWDSCDEIHNLLFDLTFENMNQIFGKRLYQLIQTNRVDLVSCHVEDIYDVRIPKNREDPRVLQVAKSFLSTEVTNKTVNGSVKKVVNVHKCKIALRNIIAGMISDKRNPLAMTGGLMDDLYQESVELLVRRLKGNSKRKVSMRENFRSQSDSLYERLRRPIKYIPPLVITNRLDVDEKEDVIRIHHPYSDSIAHVDDQDLINGGFKSLLEYFMNSEKSNYWKVDRSFFIDNSERELERTSQSSGERLAHQMPFSTTLDVSIGAIVVLTVPYSGLNRGSVGVIREYVRYDLEPVWNLSTSSQYQRYSKIFAHKIQEDIRRGLIVHRLSGNIINDDGDLERAYRSSLPGGRGFFLSDDEIEEENEIHLSRDTYLRVDFGSHGFVDVAPVRWVFPEYRSDHVNRADQSDISVIQFPLINGPVIPASRAFRLKSDNVILRLDRRKGITRSTLSGMFQNAKSKSDVLAVSYIQKSLTRARQNLFRDLNRSPRLLNLSSFHMDKKDPVLATLSLFRRLDVVKVETFAETS